jgi:hypothetical protein
MAKMARITTKSIEPDSAHLDNGVIVSLYVQTSTGRFTFPFAVKDQRNTLENEGRAHNELRTFLQEALKACNGC